MMFSLKPEHAWPAGIIFLLVFGALTSLSSLYFAASDGGVNIVDNYYQEALTWDEHAALVKDSEALGWRIVIDISNSPSEKGYFSTKISIENNDLTPVADVSGILQISRPDKADWEFETVLIPDTTAGQYFVSLPLDQNGLWDFEFDLKHNTDRFWTKIRKYDVRIDSNI